MQYSPAAESTPLFRPWAMGVAILLVLVVLVLRRCRGAAEALPGRCWAPLGRLGDPHLVNSPKTASVLIPVGALCFLRLLARSGRPSRGP